MYKIMEIGGVEYRLEYTMEAALYSECVETLVDFVGKTVAAQNLSELTSGLEEEKQRQVMEMAIKQSISSLTELPQTAITVFYAGLLEHHGVEGDGTVLNKKDAKALVKQYFAEHAEDGTDNFFDLINICMEQINEDGFFKRIGLEKMLSQEQAEKKPKKTPQDHKRKASVKQS